MNLRKIQIHKLKVTNCIVNGNNNQYIGSVPKEEHGFHVGNDYVSK